MHSAGTRIATWRWLTDKRRSQTSPLASAIISAATLSDLVDVHGATDLRRSRPLNQTAVSAATR